MTRPSGARWSSPGTVSAIQALSVASKTAARRLDAVSSGPEEPEVLRVGAHHVAQEDAQHARGLGEVRAGRGDVDRVGTEVGEAQVARQQAAVGVGRGPHAPLASRSQAVQLSGAAPLARRRARRAGRSASTPPARPGARGSRAPPPAAPDGPGRCPPPAARPPPEGPSSPWGWAGRSSASAGVRGRPPRVPRAGSAAISSSTSSSVAAMSWCISAGSSPSTKRGSYP